MASLEDKFAIQELIARYSHAIDSSNYEAWIDCFAEDGAFQGSRGRRFVGRAELKKFTEDFEARRATMYPNVRHCVMNTVTDVDGVNARCHPPIYRYSSPPRKAASSRSVADMRIPSLRRTENGASRTGKSYATSGQREPGK